MEQAGMRAGKRGGGRANMRFGVDEARWAGSRASKRPLGGRAAFARACHASSIARCGELASRQGGCGERCLGGRAGGSASGRAGELAGDRVSGRTGMRDAAARVPIVATRATPGAAG